MISVATITLAVHTSIVVLVSTALASPTGVTRDNLIRLPMKRFLSEGVGIGRRQIEYEQARVRELTNWASSFGGTLPGSPAGPNPIGSTSAHLPVVGLPVAASPVDPIFTGSDPSTADPPAPVIVPATTVLVGYTVDVS